MAKSKKRPTKTANRKWFDLKTARGWVETACALVGIIIAAVGVYLQHYSATQPGVAVTAPVTQTGTGNIIGSGNVVSITGYTVEQHEERLKKRETELHSEFKLTLETATKDRKAVEQELKAVRAQLTDLEKSHKERITELQRVAGELEQFRDTVPAQKIKQALEALANGDTQLADAVFAEVEATAQDTIEIAAKAAYERGRIAHDEVRWQDARAHFQKADRLHTNQKVYGDWAARLAALLGDYSSAGRQYEAILAHVRETNSDEAPETATAMGNLAALYAAQGRYDEAELLQKKTIATNEQALPADDPNLAASYNNLARLYFTQGRYDEVERLQRKAIAINEQALPADHQNLARNYNNLAELYFAQGRHDEAELLYKKAFAINEKALPADHPDRARDYTNLAALYAAQGRHDEAELLYKKAIAINEQALPAGHPDLATGYNNLAGVYVTQGRYDEAELLYKKAIAIDEKALPADHPGLATDYTNLAALYAAQGRHDEAEPLYKEALNILVAKLGKQHLYTKTTAENFAQLLEQTDRKKEAAELRKEYGL